MASAKVVCDGPGDQRAENVEWRAVADLGKKISQSVTVTYEAIYDLKVSHDGKWIALARCVGEKTAELRVLEAATGRRERDFMRGASRGGEI